MAEDVDWFRTGAQLASQGFKREGINWIKVQENADRHVPLYKAKMTQHFDHRAAGYGERGDDRGYRVLPETTCQQHADPSFEPEPFYWVQEREVERRLDEMSWTKGWLMGWKDVTSATNERTAIFSIVPRVAVGHSMPLVFPGTAPILVAGLLANLCALTLDYCARIKVAGLHLTSGYLRQFPILPPDFYTEPRLAFIVPRVLELTYTSHALSPFARDLGYEGPPFPWDEDRRAHLRADLDAFYARAYGLTREELRYILDPADVKGSDYPSETFRVLKEKERRQYDEYRTHRLVLSAWDRMEAACKFKTMGM
jgi:hypothetical protein